jgi:hypothetical protein
VVKLAAVVDVFDIGGETVVVEAKGGSSLLG